MDSLQDFLTEVGPSAEIADTETHDDDYAQSLAHSTYQSHSPSTTDPTQILYSYDNIIERGYNE